MAERQVRIDEIVDAALRLAADARPAYLDNACGTDADLRSVVDSLLLNASRAEQFLDAPIAADITKTVAMERGSLVGKQLGVYRIDFSIDGGGQGDVYKAYDTPYRQNIQPTLGRRPNRPPEGIARSGLL